MENYKKGYCYNDTKQETTVLPKVLLETILNIAIDTPGMPEEGQIYLDTFNHEIWINDGDGPKKVKEIYYGTADGPKPITDIYRGTPSAITLIWKPQT